MRELLKLNEEKLLFYDIETASQVKELELDTPLFDSWAYKVNKDGSKTDQEIIESYSKEAGLYPEFAKIISVVVGFIENGGIKLVTIDDENESDLLNKFNKGLGNNMDKTLIGFVNVGFDTPFVFKRMLINGIKPNNKVDSSGLKPWEVEEVDLAKIWQGTSFNRASLINIATAFGLPSPKDDIDGSQVGSVYWNEGAEGLTRISKYCRRDVATTINIFKKMRLEEPLEVRSGRDFEEIPLVANIFGGGAFGKSEQLELRNKLVGMTVSERAKAYVILDSMVSNAKGKKTKITKAHIKAYKKELDE